MAYKIAMARPTKVRNTLRAPGDMRVTGYKAPPSTGRIWPYIGFPSILLGLIGVLTFFLNRG